jgi:hypothetical protein
MNKFFTLDNDVMDVAVTDKILFRSANEFSVFIINTANKTHETLTATILDYCEERDIDIESITKLISKNLKDRIALEMKEAGLMPHSSTGMFDGEDA